MSIHARIKEMLQLIAELEKENYNTTVLKQLLNLSILISDED